MLFGFSDAAFFAPVVVLLASTVAVLFASSGFVAETAAAFAAGCVAGLVLGLEDGVVLIGGSSEGTSSQMRKASLWSEFSCSSCRALAAEFNLQTFSLSRRFSLMGTKNEVTVAWGCSTASSALPLASSVSVSVSASAFAWMGVV